MAVAGWVVLSVSAMTGCTVIDDFLRQVDGDRPSVAASKSSPGPTSEQSTRRPSDVAGAAVPRRPEPSRPDTIVGASEGEASDLFGAPSSVADNPPAIVWEYLSEKCQLSLFFYNDVATNVYRVLTYKVTPKAADATACFDAVRRKRG